MAILSNIGGARRQNRERRTDLKELNVTRFITMNYEFSRIKIGFHHTNISELSSVLLFLFRFYSTYDRFMKTHHNEKTATHCG